MCVAFPCVLGLLQLVGVVEALFKTHGARTMPAFENLLLERVRKVWTLSLPLQSKARYVYFGFALVSFAVCLVVSSDGRPGVRC